MLIEFQNNITYGSLFLWANFGILPFWLMIIFIPNFKITQIFVNSIVIPFILALLYSYVFYQAFITDKTFIFESFNLYSGLDSLYTVLSNEIFLLLFWFHFLALNLFLGGWISKDALKYNISKRIVFFPLVLTYFVGPLGLFLYWLIRIFYAKKISLYD
jgi:hypothetical protein